MTNPDSDIDYYRYDEAEEEMSREEAIEELMEEGYSEDEAIRMLGDYDPDEYGDYDHDDDIPEVEDIPDWDDEDSE